MFFNYNLVKDYNVKKITLSLINICILTAFLSSFCQASLPNDPIQRCLDVRRLVHITTKEKMQAKEPGVLRFKFRKIPSTELPINNPVGNMEEVINSLQHQINNCKNKPGEFQTINIAGREFSRQEWCLDTNNQMLTLAKAANGNFKKFLISIKQNFDWYKSEGWPENHAGFKKGSFRFTAYYAPTAIEARSKRGGGFEYPIYSNPGVVHVATENKKLNTNQPLCGIDPISKAVRGFCIKDSSGKYSIPPDREEIDNGALDPKFIIAYVKDPKDIDFLMVQGSGSLNLDGKITHINYDGANGRPRSMLGRIVQCAQDPTCGGNLDNMETCAKNPKCHDEAKLRCNISKKIKQSGATEKLIRKYLDHPLNRDKARDLRNRDQSFVFFVKEDEGPYGSEKITLTPHGSCATDHKVIPVGVNFIYNLKKSTSWCIAQDSGGAIKGAHVDIYTGKGIQAGKEANGINHSGALFVALPKKMNDQSNYN